MLYRKTDDYDSFRCLAGKCPRSCCEGWQIVIDEDSLEKYKTLGGPLAERLAQDVDRKESVFCQHGSRCAFLADDGLCDLQRVYGEEALCATCTRYPRHEEEFEDVREYSLSLSCPEAARMLLTRREPMRFTCWESDEEDDFEEFDFLLYDRLDAVRERLFAVAQDRSVPLWERLVRLYAMGLSLQQDLEEDAVADMEDNLDAKTEAQMEAARQFFSYEGAKRDYDVLYQLEMLYPDWVRILDETWERAYEGGLTAWEMAHEWSEDQQIAGEQILMFFLYTYFCGAVYDDGICSKVALAVRSTQWILEMTKAHDADDGAAVLQDIAVRYAREVEHSDENLVALDDWWNL